MVDELYFDLLMNITQEVSGKYFFGGHGRTIESSALSRDPKLAKELWDTSCIIFNKFQYVS